MTSPTQPDHRTVYCVGSVNLDQTIFVDRLPVTGETVIGNDLQVAAGGKGGNQALAARRAGAAVQFIGAVGDDSAADSATKWLRQDGVDLRHLHVVDATTGLALIAVDRHGENTIVIHPGANQLVTPEMVHEGLAEMQATDFLLLQQEIPPAAIMAALTIAQAAQAQSVLNIAPFLPESGDLAPMANYLIANRTEFSQLTCSESSDLDGALLDWCRNHPEQTTIVTLGQDGVVWCKDQQPLSIPAEMVDPVDTVGAGDTFCGYFTAALTGQDSCADAIRLAMAAARRACLKSGAQPSIPYASATE